MTKENPPVNISSFRIVDASEKGADMPLLDPVRGKPTGATLRVLGSDAPEVVASVRAAYQEAMTSQQDLSPEDRLALRNRATALAAIVGWEKFFWEGKELEFSREKFQEIVSDPNYSWIAHQVHEFSTSRANFFPGGSID